MATVKIGTSHRARKQLFQRGLSRGFLTVQEIETDLPPGSLTAAERWLLYYSLRAAEVEIRDETGELTTVPGLTAEEFERLAEERSRNPEGSQQAAEADDELEPGEARVEPGSEEARRIEEALASLEGPAADSH